MGEAGKDALRVGCTTWTLGSDRAIKLEFHGAKVSSDAGLFPYRGLDEALELTQLAGEVFRDLRRGKNTQHELVGLLR